MSNVAHSTLTGANLHEPKGVAAATVDKVYVSDGAGSGAWQKITASQLTGTGNPFGGNLFHIQHKVASGGGDGSPLSANTWTQRNINTVVTNEISGASLTTSTINLPAGTFWIDWRTPYVWGDAVDYFQTRLYNATSGTVITVGNGSIANSTSDPRQTIWSSGRQRFTLSVPSGLWIQHISLRAFSSGSAASNGDNIYTDVTVFKVS